MIFKRLICLILCLVSLLSLSAAAYAEESVDELPVIFDEAELLKMTEDFIASHHVKAENFSVGFVYTATGDTWMYNEDNWYYSASLYKVPLMMIFAEKVAAGEMTPETDINGISLAQANTDVLTYSSNYYGHHMMNYLGGDRQARLLYQNYSDLPKEEYDQDFYDYSYFSARFMTDVMKKLYYESERFPHVIDSIMHAQDDQHFELSIKDYEVAQKYGAYEQYYHNSAIIYTPNPIILIVMTEKASYINDIFADYADMMVKYTLKLDEKLEAHKKAVEEEEKRQAEEAARLEEEARLKAEEEERIRLEEEAAKRAEEERIRLEEEKTAARAKLMKTAGIAAAVIVIVIAIAVALISSAGKKKARRRRDMERREAPQKKNSGKNSYTPRH